MALIPFSEEQIVERIRFENPWWKLNAIEQHYDRMKRRLYFKLFYPLTANTKVQRAVVLMGPRRVGKTVMIYHAIQALMDAGVPARKICYLSVDTPIYNKLGLEQLFGLCRRAVGDENPQDFYVFFDEIQYLRDWEVHLKSLVDSYRHCKFTVSGSAAAALRLKSHESGAGRFTDFTLPPLTFHEYINMLDLDGLILKREKEWNGKLRAFFDSTDLNMLNQHFFNYLNFGGYPEVIFSPEIQKDPGRFIRNDIIDKVLLRDLPSMYGIQDVQELNSLFTTIAYNSGNEFSLESLNQSSHVEKNTIKRYLEYLEAAFLVKTIHRIDMGGKRFKRANFFKICLTNPSLRSALFSPIAQTDDNAGLMVETGIYAQWLHRTDDIFYSRWQNGEVDIVGLNSKLQPSFAVEIKWSNRYFEVPGDLKSLTAFLRQNKLLRAMVTTIDKSGEKELEGCKIDFVPSALYAYTLGRNSVDEKLEQITSS